MSSSCYNVLAKATRKLRFFVIDVIVVSFETCAILDINSMRKYMLYKSCKYCRTLTDILMFVIRTGALVG